MSLLWYALYGYCLIGAAVLVYFIRFTRQRHVSGSFAVPRKELSGYQRSVKGECSIRTWIDNYVLTKAEREKFAAMSTEEKLRDLFPDHFEKEMKKKKKTQ